MRRSAGTWSGKTSEVPCIPFQASILGRTFRKPAHPESPSHFGRIRAWNLQPIRPSINKEAPARRRNIRFIASSARAGEHLMCSPCEQDCPSREPYIPPPGRRYI